MISVRNLLLTAEDTWKGQIMTPKYRWQSAADNHLWRFALLAIPLVLVSAPQIPEQSAPSASEHKPSFEVASVRRSGPREGTSFHILPNRLTVRNYLTAFLIEWAYGHDLGDFGFMKLRENQLVGGPGWVHSGEFGYEGYDIEAKVDDSLAEQFGKDCGMAFFYGRCAYRQQMMLMFQSLFEDRFKLRVRHDTKEGPVYALVVAKGGPKFQSSLPTDSELHMHDHSTPPPKREPCPPRWLCLQEYTTMAQLADWFSGDPQLGRPVIDRTGLQGVCYIKLQFAREQSPGGMSTGQESGSAGTGLAPPPVPSGPSIFTALQQQLGLKLKPTKGPVETLVIEHIERPSEN